MLYNIFREASEIATFLLLLIPIKQQNLAKRQLPALREDTFAKNVLVCWPEGTFMEK